MAHAYEPYLLAQERVIGVGVVNRVYLWFWTVFLGGMLTVRIGFLFRAREHQEDQVNAQTISPDGVFWTIALILGLPIVIGFWRAYVKRFVITNKRVLIISGIFGVDVTALAYKQIRNVSLRVTLLDRLFGIGTIAIDSGKIHSQGFGRTARTQTHYDYFSHISDPYTTYTVLQEQMMDG